MYRAVLHFCVVESSNTCVQPLYIKCMYTYMYFMYYIYLFISSTTIPGVTSWTPAQCPSSQLARLTDCTNLQTSLFVSQVLSVKSICNDCWHPHLAWKRHRKVYTYIEVDIAESFSRRLVLSIYYHRFRKVFTPHSSDVAKEVDIEIYLPSVFWNVQ